MGRQGQQKKAFTFFKILATIQLTFWHLPDGADAATVAAAAAFG